MSEHNWVSKEACLAFHAELITRFGGLHGIRDEDLLDSALARSQQLFNYGTPTIVEMAAAYAEGIVKNRPFLDGNKRSGVLAAALFLETNGLIFTAPEEEAVLQTLALASGEIGAAEYNAWLEANARPRE